MKKHRLTLAATLLAIILVASFACSKYTDTSTPTDTTPPDQTVTASLQGRVLDENGLPVKGAVVTSGVATTTTDVNGVFTFSNISMSSRFGFVKVVKQGYFTGSRSILTNAGGQNYINIHLLPRVAKGSFSAAGGGNVVVQAGNTVAFDASSVVNAATNAAYTGNVNVFATYLDPTDADLPNHIPGDLRGISAAGKEVALQSFGMMGVELEGNAGEKLQIASGKKATLTLAIPAALQASAPDSIPLWYFNDSTGKWMEQGKAVRQGNNYVGQVGHFSFWNCDVSSSTASFKVRLKDQHGNPLAYTYIQFTSPTYGTRGGFTDTTGYAQGIIPKGQTLLFQVLSSCGTLLYGQNVGPVLTDEDLGNPTVDVSNGTVVLNGTVVDCSNNPVVNGYVNAYIDGLNYRSGVTNGAFTLNISRCSVAPAQAQLTAGDYGTSQQGNASTISVTTGSQNAGQLSACGVSLTQFINVTFNGNTYSVTAPPDSVTYYYQSQPSASYFTGNSATGVTPHLRFSFQIPNLTGTGAYSTNSFDMGVGSRTFWPLSGTSIQYSVTAYGAVNGFITGNLSGTLQDTVSRVSYPMTGNFKVKRTN
ncbi:MAG TPA: carboxypeptidase-like regulatory domain-containing protein [Puia sp.]